MISAGIADPYWYEWYVGMSHVIKMLDSDNEIASVIFQKGDYNTIDDVVVRYINGRQEYCYQVKHEIETSAKKGLTFNELIKKDDKGKSLISTLIDGWSEASLRTGNDIIPILFTNRSSGKNKTRRIFNGSEYQAIPLDEFIIKIKQKITEAEESGKLAFADSENDLQMQWREFSDALDAPDGSRISFICKFLVEASQASLSELRQSQIVAIGKVFGCSSEVAEKLFNRLIAELQIWTTSTRTSEEVTVGIVYEALSTKLEIPNEQHRLAPPGPFFKSREEFCKNIVNEISQSTTPIIFINGEPGSGKTSIINHIQAMYDFFAIRYHAFRPISPEQRFYNADMGLCEPRQLWTEFLIQIRIKLKGKLHKHSVPVICDYLSDIDLRSEVLRLLGVMSQETGKTVYVCIDGIDHAARSNLPVTFLSSLYSPTEIPNGVCYVIVGQPPNLYSNYPLWLRIESSSVMQIKVPPLVKSDITQLVANMAPQFSECAERVSELVFPLTKGNNLSIVYAVESIKLLTSFEELIELSRSGQISHDINQYYDNIWAHVADAIIKKNISVNFAESKVADAILLLNGRIYTRLLHEALVELPMSITEWDQLMELLYPLVVPSEIKHEYNLFHNDFRVFLMGIGSKYPQIYKDISYQIARYLHESEWGIVKYKNLIPLLKCAEKPSLAADWFDVAFVINALAEGLTYHELDDFAAIAYSEAVKARHIHKYHNVSLALATLHQHYKYYEYYSRKYDAISTNDIIPVDISEMQAKPLSRHVIDIYYDVLVRCKSLYKADTPDMHRRANALYDLWFSSRTPVSFVRELYPQAEYPETHESETNLEETLKLWGETSAMLRLRNNDLLQDRPENELHEYEMYAEMLFGDAYFSYFIEHDSYENAVSSIGYVRISVKCVIEKMEKILLSGNTSIFTDIIERLLSRELEESERLFASAIILVADSMRQDCVSADELSKCKPINHYFDKSSLSAVAIAYITGTLNSSKDDIIIISQIYQYLDIKDNDGNNKKNTEYLKLLMRISAMIGKYNYLIAKSPGVSFSGKLLFQQLHAFFEKPAARSFDFSSSFRFLLYVILNTSAVECMTDIEALCSDLKHVLHTFQHIGMHYKSIILDFLMKKGRQDIVLEYLLALYGANGELLCRGEDWASTHKHFLKYSSAYIPDISSAVSVRLKWDIVSYSGHKEDVISRPLDIYKHCAEKAPDMWETYGARLYNLSSIADNFSNSYSLEVIEALNRSAVRCGIASFWKLHHLDSDFHFDLNVLHRQLNDLLEMCHTEQDITAIWLLACGLLSWYDNNDRALLPDIYLACAEKAKAFGNNTFPDSVVKLTPSQYTIVSNEPEKTEYNRSSDLSDYYIQKEKKNEAYEQKVKMLSIDDIIEDHVNVGSSIGEWDYVDIAWKEILSRNEMSDAVAVRFMNTIAIKLEDSQWKWQGCEYILNQLKDSLKWDAFWRLAEIIGARLPEYDYQTSTRNTSYLLLLYADLLTDDMLPLLGAELNCQEHWISGNGKIPFPEIETEIVSSLQPPENLYELAISILLEQFRLNNIHRNEIAISGVYALCASEPALYHWLSDNWEVLTSEQKDAMIIICERWGREAPDGIENLIDVLKKEFEKSDRLSEKIKLYSILNKYAHAKNDSLISMTFSTPPKQYTLPIVKYNTLIDDSVVPVGVKAFLMLNADVTEGYDIGADIIKYIRDNIGVVEKAKEYYSRSGDCLLVRNPGMLVLDPVLYGEERSGRWDHLPLEWHMQFFLDIDDALVTTTPPTIVYNDVWNIEKELEACLKDTNYMRAEVLVQAIIHFGLKKDEQVLGACLWYPVGHYDKGVVVYHTLKAIHNSELLCSKRINQTFVNYSILADSDSLFEPGSDDIYNGGVCLVRSIVGAAQFILGNCQIYPANYLQSEFKWTPLFSNPFIWTDDSGEYVIKFERILCPNRDTQRQHYHRQPMLFRWVADKNKLENQLSKHGLLIRSVYDTMPYERVINYNDD